MKEFYPEGMLIKSKNNLRYFSSVGAVAAAAEAVCRLYLLFVLFASYLPPAKKAHPRRDVPKKCFPRSLLHELSVRKLEKNTFYQGIILRTKNIKFV